ncbi:MULTISPECIES: DUF2971 domain-containing protein [Clostridium]|jgi:hypothetical protein|uniref:DUF2971 domain-containing protein n=1 Tax=Clostridium TaxID=1485 RepID=UPI000DD0BC14|nr:MULTISPECIES: DUF2971 domain-containing protein [Clostridium]MBS5886550.1 DUF2971 domain-containing protein [Clostridium sp.]MDB1939193.1 DUF2971 domain-containing protein [Clostridium tertium]MDU8967716.1 DUF2971 domain-containing protein [Clostridium sp.]
MNEIRKNEWFKDDYNTLYHFTSIDSLIKILITDTFRLSCINKMNDINELLPLSKKFDSINKDKRIIEYEKDIRKKTFVGCFNVLEKDQDIRDKVSMWGNYADSGKGICLEIDKSKLDQKLWKLIYDVENDAVKCGIHIDKFKIKYERQSYIEKTKERFFEQNMYTIFPKTDDEFALEDDNICEDVIDRAIKNRVASMPRQEIPLYMVLKMLFGIKSEEWKSENEYRYLFYDHFSYTDWFNINGFSDVIRNVFVGENQDVENIKLLRNIKDKLLPNVNFFIRVKNSETEISSKEIDELINMF